MLITCQTIMTTLDKLAPLHLAESWDNSGLLIGHPQQAVTGIVVALDVDQSAVTAAIEGKANLIVAHHPLLFKPLTAIRQDSAQGALISRILRNDIIVVAMHTNLDAAAGGVNDVLAEVLELSAIEPLVPQPRNKLMKLAVYVPKSHLQTVREALLATGAGHIGLYSHCSFAATGEGTFMPQLDSTPFVGRQGQLEYVAEYKLETVVTQANLAQVMSVLKTVHPYEEIAYDLYGLENELPPLTGMGRVGMLRQPLSLQKMAQLVKSRLKISAVKVSGMPENQIKRVAVCGGSGSNFIEQALSAAADVLITGDVKYHEAQHALSNGLALIDAGHFATEIPVVSCLQRYLNNQAENLGWEIPIIAHASKDIFWFA